MPFVTNFPALISLLKSNATDIGISFALEENQLGEVAAAIKAHKGIKSLTLGQMKEATCCNISVIVEAVKSHNSLEYLKVYENAGSTKISDEAFRSISELLVTQPKLSSLIFQSVDFGDEAATTIARGMSANKSLTSLDLSLCTISSVGSKAIAQALATHRHLERLDWTIGKLAGAEDAIALMVETNANLRMLTLNLCDITDQGAISIARALKANTSLEVLDLGDNAISDGAATAFADALKVNRTLREISLNGALDLVMPVIGNVGVEALGDALVINSNLRSLSLWCNNFDDYGAWFLATSLQKNTTLLHLFIESSLRGKNSQHTLSPNSKDQLYSVTQRNKGNFPQSFQAQLGDLQNTLTRHPITANTNIIKLREILQELLRAHRTVKFYSSLNVSRSNEVKCDATVPLEHWGKTSLAVLEKTGSLAALKQAILQYRFKDNPLYLDARSISKVLLSVDEILNAVPRGIDDATLKNLKHEWLFCTVAFCLRTIDPQTDDGSLNPVHPSVIQALRALQLIDPTRSHYQQACDEIAYYFVSLTYRTGMPVEHQWRLRESTASFSDSIKSTKPIVGNASEQDKLLAVKRPPTIQMERNLLREISNAIVTVADEAQLCEQQWRLKDVLEQAFAQANETSKQALNILHELVFLTDDLITPSNPFTEAQLQVLEKIAPLQQFFADGGASLLTTKPVRNVREFVKDQQRSSLIALLDSLREDNPIDPLHDDLAICKQFIEGSAQSPRLRTLENVDELNRFFKEGFADVLVGQPVRNVRQFLKTQMSELSFGSEVFRENLHECYDAFVRDERQVRRAILAVLENFVSPAGGVFNLHFWGRHFATEAEQLIQDLQKDQSLDAIESKLEETFAAVKTSNDSASFFKTNIQYTSLVRRLMYGLLLINQERATQEQALSAAPEVGPQ